MEPKIENNIFNTTAISEHKAKAFAAYETAMKDLYACEQAVAAAQKKYQEAHNTLNGVLLEKPDA